MGEERRVRQPARNSARALGAAAVLGLLLGATGCDRILAAVPTGWFEELAERPDSSSDLESLDSGNATQIYYQFIDGRNQVRFVTSLEMVPEAWRDRVGHVELDQPPPMSPADMARIQAARDARYAERIALQLQGPEVVIYSADWCPACVRAKRHMDRQGIEYEERNVDLPQYKEELVEVSGGRSIPVIQIDGDVMKGFNAQRLDQLLAAAR